MIRSVTGFHLDEEGDWVAELSCHHGRHVRHQPPFRVAAWVLDPAERAARVGVEFDCPRCDRAELPDGLEVVRRTDTWDQGTAPAGLRRAHRVASGVWGLLRVEAGALDFHAATQPPLHVHVVAGDRQPIPPDVEHHIETPGEVRFHVEFLRPPR